MHRQRPGYEDTFPYLGYHSYSTSLQEGPSSCSQPNARGDPGVHPDHPRGRISLVQEGRPPYNASGDLGFDIQQPGELPGVHPRNIQTNFYHASRDTKGEDGRTPPPNRLDHISSASRRAVTFGINGLGQRLDQTTRSTLGQASRPSAPVAIPILPSGFTSNQRALESGRLCTVVDSKGVERGSPGTFRLRGDTTLHNRSVEGERKYANIGCNDKSSPGSSKYASGMRYMPLGASNALEKVSDVQHRRPCGLFSNDVFEPVAEWQLQAGGVSDGGSSAAPPTSNVITSDDVGQAFSEISRMYRSYFSGELSHGDEFLLVDMGFKFASKVCLVDKETLGMIVFLEDMIVEVHADMDKYRILARDPRTGLQEMKNGLLKPKGCWSDLW